MIDKEWTRSPILIGGHEKSGTNLILSLLDYHTELVVFAPGHLHLFGLNLERVSSIDGKNRIEFVLERPIIKKLRQGWVPKGGDKFTVEFDFEEFESHLRSVGPNYSWSNILQNIFIGYKKSINQGKNKIKGFVENTPGTEHEFHIASSFYPNSKMIYLLRDARDVWNSWKDAGKGRDERSIWGFVSSWLSSTVAAMCHFKRHNGDFLILDYNTLVQRTDETMTEVAEFLDIQYKDTLTKPTKIGEPWGGNSRHFEDFEDVSSKSVGKYKQGLSEREIEVINKFCTPLYKKCTNQNQLETQGWNIPINSYFSILNPLLYKDQNDNLSVKRYIIEYMKFGYISRKSIKDLTKKGL